MSTYHNKITGKISGTSLPCVQIRNGFLLCHYLLLLLKHWIAVIVYVGMHIRIVLHLNLLVEVPLILYSILHFHLLIINLWSFHLLILHFFLVSSLEFLLLFFLFIAHLLLFGRYFVISAQLGDIRLVLIPLIINLLLPNSIFHIFLGM